MNTACSNVDGRSGLFQVNCLWVGGELRPLEQVSLLSMQKQGHAVRLFTYGAVTNVPDGVEVADANEVLPWKRMIFNRRTGSPALGSNRFRYRLMRMGLGLWLDADMLLLKPILKRDGHLFGRQDETFVNGAALFLPAASPVLEDLIAFIGDDFAIPPFLPMKERLRLALRKWTGRPRHVSRMTWGVFGPMALTHFIGKHGLTGEAVGRDVFYPVPYTDAHSLFMADADIERCLESTTLAIHLWNEALRRPSHLRPDNPTGRLFVEKGSFVERYAREELGFALGGDA
ncbi:hypothetical protein [Parvibaculum sp.]|uniref:hypothetical protein n=1 Tax=Parvibaculum sp. TaxID=2024848 RepID=UPI00320D2E18